MLMSQFKSRSVFFLYYGAIPFSLVLSATKLRQRDPTAAATLNQDNLAPTSKCSL
jgi:hypothetical protein